MSTADILKIFGINFGINAVLFILAQFLIALWLRARLEVLSIAEADVSVNSRSIKKRGEFEMARH